MSDSPGVDYLHKDDFRWISLIRLPDFVKKEDFDWAVSEASGKKKQDFSDVLFFPFEEGECVQCMHIGPYDNEPATVKAMEEYAKKQGYELDFHMEQQDITMRRYHHEIYLSDARKCSPDKQRTVIRHPVKKIEKGIE